MDKAHKIENLSFSGTTMLLRVDGKDYQIEITRQSQRLAAATPEQRQNFVVSPSGYGIHWPDVDEDLSVDGLIGIRHHSPFGEKTEENSRKKKMTATAP
jgi:hypothetical protein